MASKKPAMYPEFAEKILQARLKLNKKQTFIADVADIHRRVLSFMENGLSYPAPRTLQKLASVLNVPMDALRVKAYETGRSWSNYDFKNELPKAYLMKRNATCQPNLLQN